MTDAFPPFVEMPVFVGAGSVNGQSYSRNNQRLIAACRVSMDIIRRVYVQAADENELEQEVSQVTLFCV